MKQPIRKSEFSCFCIRPYFPRFTGGPSAPAAVPDLCTAAAFKLTASITSQASWRPGKSIRRLPPSLAKFLTLPRPCLFPHDWQKLLVIEV